MLNKNNLVNTKFFGKIFKNEIISYFDAPEQDELTGTKIIGIE